MGATTFTEQHALSATQADAVAYMLRPESDGAALLAFDMGLGKTRTGLMFAREYEAEVVLVVAPLQTHESWAETAGRELPDMTVNLIDTGKGGKKALANFQWRVPGIYLIGPEYWERLAWVKQEFKTKRRVMDTKTGKMVPEVKTRKVKSGNWDGGGFLFIYDESHRSANVQSWTHKALMNLDPSVFKLSMSGTFFGDKFDGSYGATRWLWPHRTDILPPDIFRWRAKWAECVYDRWAPRNQKVVGEIEEGAYVRALPCYIRVENDMPDPIEKKIWVELGDEQRRVYDELDTRMVAWIEENPLVTKLSITRRARQRQITLAMPTLTFSDVNPNELEDVTFADDAESVKYDALADLLSNDLADTKVLVLTDSQKFARLITDRLNAEFGAGTAAEWSGQIKRPLRVANKEAFIDGDLRIIVGVPAAMGTGTDGLQYAANHLVFMSRSERRIDNEQAIARLNRTGQVNPVYVWSIMARNTIDTGQLSAQVQRALAANRSMRKKPKEEPNDPA